MRRISAGLPKDAVVRGLQSCRPGSTIGICAPSGALPDPDKLPIAVKTLEGLGYRVRIAPGIEARQGYSAGTPEDRLRSLMALVDDPEVSLIMAARGGFGLSHLLPLIDWPRIAASQKLFVGFSDVTAFHLALYATTGQISIAGPMAVSDFASGTLSPLHAKHFFEWLAHPESPHETAPWESDIDHGHGEYRGTLWGGNLSLVTHLIGTPYCPKIDGGLLFLEDIGEAPYRIERMWMQLELAGILERQTAVILGAFTGAEPPAHLPIRYTLEELITSLRRRFHGPIITGLPFGHIQHKVSLPIGAEAHLKTQGQHISLRFDPIA